MGKTKSTYKTITINGDRYDITTGGSIRPAGTDRHIAYIDLHPYYDGHKGSRALSREARQLVAA